MNSTTALSFKGLRFPAEIISHASWLYYRFFLSYRDVEELLAERGVVVTYETVRQRCLRFGRSYANQLRRHRARSGDKGFLDEVFLKVNGETHYLGRAVDQDGHGRDILALNRRNKAAAKKFFRKLLNGCQYVPRVTITDKLGRYEAAKKEVMPSVEHRRHRRLNIRAENSHQPTQQWNVRRVAASPPAMPNASFPLLGRSENISARHGIGASGRVPSGTCAPISGLERGTQSPAGCVGSYRRGTFSPSSLVAQLSPSSLPSNLTVPAPGDPIVG